MNEKTYIAIAYPDGTYELVSKPPLRTPSTAVVNGETLVHVFWFGCTDEELINADDMVIPVHNRIMDDVLARQA